MADTFDVSTVRRREVEEQVLRAAEELLGAGASYADLNVERIATRAGIGRTAFYFYFRDKRELLMRLTAEVTERLYEEATAWWSGEGPDDLDRALGSVAALYAEHGPLLRAVVEVATYDAEVGDFWRALVGRFVDATHERLAAEQAAGRIDAAIPAHPTAFALTWMTERTFFQALVQGAPVEGVVEAVTGVWRRSLYG